MARTETNEAKRDLMSRVVEARLRDGWTITQLAALMWVQPGTVRNWKNGATMGTNGQRRELAELKPPAEARPQLLEAARLHRNEAAVADKRNAAAWAACAFEVQKRHAARAKRLRARADFLESIGAPE